MCGHDGCLTAILIHLARETGKVVHKVSVLAGCSKTAQSILTCNIIYCVSATFWIKCMSLLGISKYTDAVLQSQEISPITLGTSIP